MKRFVATIIASMLIFLSPTISKADFLDFWLYGGIATPNDHIATVYTENWLNKVFSEPEEFFIGSSDYGWTIGVNPRFELDDRAHLNISLSYLNFPAATSKVVNPNTKEVEPFFDTKTTIIPITVGADYYLTDSMFGLYVKADIQYHYLSNTIEDINDAYSEVTNLGNQKIGRFGAGVGAGIDIDLPLAFDLGIEVNYNWINLIGKDDDEFDKEYLGMLLMIRL